MWVSSVAEKQSLAEKIILFLFFIVFASIIVGISLNWNYIGDDETSSETVSVQYKTESKSQNVSESSNNSDTITVVNINTADEGLLDTLPGIGKVKAQAIIKYRESVGKFNSVDELVKVNGISDSTLEKLRPYITVE